MVLLSPQEMRQYDALGFVVIPAPSGAALAEQCLAVCRQLQARATAEQVAAVDGKGNHWRLMPITADSYWTALDHSEPFLHTCLHAEVLQIGRQLAAHDDIWMRNAGINELAPGRQAQWHHDGGDECRGPAVCHSVASKLRPALVCAGNRYG